MSGGRSPVLISTALSLWWTVLVRRNKLVAAVFNSLAAACSPNIEKSKELRARIRDKRTLTRRLMVPSIGTRLASRAAMRSSAACTRSTRLAPKGGAGGESARSTKEGRAPKSWRIYSRRSSGATVPPYGVCRSSVMVKDDMPATPPKIRPAAVPL